jgi:hypothetical protein
MEEVIKEVASYVALAVEVAAIAIVGFGALEAFLRILKVVLVPQKSMGERKSVWLRFGMWRCWDWSSSWRQTLCGA